MRCSQRLRLSRPVRQTTMNAYETPIPTDCPFHCRVADGVPPQSQNAPLLLLRRFTPQRPLRPTNRRQVGAFRGATMDSTHLLHRSYRIVFCSSLLERLRPSRATVSSAHRTCNLRRRVHACRPRLAVPSTSKLDMCDTFLPTAATPNHALQRTRAAVTPAASGLRLSPATQRSRQPRGSLSLGSLAVSSSLP